MKVFFRRGRSEHLAEGPPCHNCGETFLCVCCPGDEETDGDRERRGAGGTGEVPFDGLVSEKKLRGVSSQLSVRYKEIGDRFSRMSRFLGSVWSCKIGET